MQASSEELLRSRGVAELRALVASLESDCARKQTDLRTMVGSKYLDFIESADAIADMFQHANQLTTIIGRLPAMGDDLVDKIYDVIQRTTSASIGNSNDSSDSNLNRDSKLNMMDQIPEDEMKRIAERAVRKIVVRPAEVWTHLEAWDVFQAARTVYMSKILLFLADQQQANSANAPKLVYLNEVQPEIKKLSSKLVKSLKSFNDWKFTSFLSQTVTSDCDLILLNQSSSVHNAAKSLASKALLSESVLNSSEILKSYLEQVDILLEVYFRDAKPAADHSTTLVELVSFIQKVLLNVHLLFFRKFSCKEYFSPENMSKATNYEDQDIYRMLTDSNNSSSNNNSNNNNGNANIECTGLFALMLSKLINEMSIDCRHFFFGNDRHGMQEHTHQFNVSSFLKSNFAKSSQSLLKKQFDIWFAEIVKKTSKLLNSSLDKMDSATDIARLQHRLWTSTTHFLAENDVTCSYQQRDWELACKELLCSEADLATTTAVAVLAGAQTDDSQKEGVDMTSKYSSLLWNLIFRSPFMTQVERILCDTCREILSRIQNRLAQCLQSEGISIDYKARRVVVNISAAASASSYHADKNEGSLLDVLNNYESNPYTKSFQTLLQSIQTTRIYRQSESIRKVIETEMKMLLKGVVIPVHESDSQSSTALSRALFVQSSHLIGHLVIFLRETSEIIGNEILKSLQVKTSNNALRKTWLLQKYQMEGFAKSIDERQTKLISVLVLIGRLSWLMKLRGKFLYDALSAYPSSAENSKNSKGQSRALSRKDYELCSEDQLISAFEIADTDGDGVLTLEEAQEAINALAVPDTIIDENSAIRSQKSLSTTLTPSLTFSEFVLVSCHLLSGKEASQIAVHFTQSIDDVITVSHHIWTEACLCVANAAFYHSLRKEMGISTGVFSRKCMWKTITVDADSFSVPSSTTQALSGYLGLMTSLMSAVATIDATQVVESSRRGNAGTDIDNGTDGNSYSISVDCDVVYGSKKNVVPCLYRAVKSSMNTKIAASVKAIYQQLHTFRKDLTQIKYSEDFLETTAIQCVFDVSVLMDLSDIFSKTLTSVHKEWSADIDPINSATMGPQMKQLASDYRIRCGVLNIFSNKSFISSTQTDHFQNKHVESNNSASDLFSTAVCPRYGLLALPLTLNPTSSSSASSHAQNFVGNEFSSTNGQSRTKGNGKELASKQGSIPASSSSTSLASSGTLKDVLSTKSFMSGISSLLGTGQS